DAGADEAAEREVPVRELDGAGDLAGERAVVGLARGAHRAAGLPRSRGGVVAVAGADEALDARLGRDRPAAGERRRAGHDVRIVGRVTAGVVAGARVAGLERVAVDRDPVGEQAGDERGPAAEGLVDLRDRGLDGDPA